MKPYPNPPSGELITLLSDTCATLGSPLRLQIIYRLAERSMDVHSLAEALEANISTTSRHLKALRERGLVRATRREAHVEYRLNDYRLLSALEVLAEVRRDRLLHRARLMNVPTTDKLTPGH